MLEERKTGLFFSSQDFSEPLTWQYGRWSSQRAVRVCHAPLGTHCLCSSRDSTPWWADQLHESQEKGRLHPGGDIIHPLSPKRRHRGRSIFHPTLFHLTLPWPKRAKAVLDMCTAASVTHLSCRLFIFRLLLLVEANRMQGLGNSSQAAWVESLAPQPPGDLEKVAKAPAVSFCPVGTMILTTSEGVFWRFEEVSPLP